MKISKLFKLLIILTFLFSIPLISAYEPNGDSPNYYNENYDYSELDSSYSEQSQNEGLWAFWVVIAFFIAYYVILIVISIWTYKDAKKRGAETPVLWLIVVLFGGILGLIVWLIIRKDIGKKRNKFYSNQMMCKNCGRFIKNDSVFCPYCSYKLNNFL